MKKIGLIALTLVLLIGVVSMAAFAAANGPSAPSSSAPRMCNPGPGGPGGPNPHSGAQGFAAVIVRLKLTPEQQQKMLEIRQNFAKDAQPLQFDIQKNQLQLKQLWTENPLNAEAIAGLEQKIALNQVKLVNMARDMMKQMHDVLTPEQQKKIQKWMAGMKGKGMFPGRRGQRHVNQEATPDQSSQGK